VSSSGVIHKHTGEEVTCALNKPSILLLTVACGCKVCFVTSNILIHMIGTDFNNMQKVAQCAFTFFVVIS
jgi:hypothetical protein